ncbi:cation:proton antiporter [Nocardia beijingensis]|uniref:cation:proton antiporter n=1 Tax=Nocardia beijingensis TaxID=95162 RepID=UPI0018946D66|nr:cation:proton antiporter [Nocardia beijingensis]MBF6468562.1 cation:proton antiporter [Nocardia beijingensis]
MPSDQMIFLLLDLVLIVAAARLLGWLAARVGQPPVIGEIVAGILAGPTILGVHLSETIFPHDTRSYLTAFANVGVMIFMFSAGLEMDLRSVAGRRRSVTAIALSAYLTPFALGSVIALWALARHDGGNPLNFALFIGCALAVTAFPVLARILHDRKLLGTRLGQSAMTCAALDDILAWCVLAVVIGIARPGLGHHWRLLLFVPLVLMMWWAVRPALDRLAGAGSEKNPANMVFIGVSGALLLGAATEWIGLHLIFGAFLFGVVFPRRLRAAVDSGAQLLSSIFLPAFFVVAGLQVNLGGLDRASIAEFAAIMGAALAGKLGGTYLAARLSRTDRTESAALAALMNTRGLTELVILNIGLTIGVIDQRLYSLLVMMALITTAMTAPLLKLFGVPRALPDGDDRRTGEKGPRTDSAVHTEATAQ